MTAYPSCSTPRPGTLGSNRKLSSLVALLKPYPAEAMTAWPIGARVNSPKNDSPECLEPQGRAAAGKWAVRWPGPPKAWGLWPSHAQPGYFAPKW